jgi:hypothetical protein
MLISMDLFAILQHSLALKSPDHTERLHIFSELKLGYGLANR